MSTLLEELEALVATREQSVADAAGLLARAQTLLQEARVALRAAQPACEAYAWIGQSFKYCDDCGKPYWEHTHIARGGGRRDPITPDSAAAVKARWDVPESEGRES